jgi:vacuolar-type H+-ATPase subunit I/STV1
MDTGRGTPKIRMKDELTNVPQYPARFENTVGYSFNVVAGALKKRGNYESFFKDLVAGESRIKERAAANLNAFLGPLEVVAGEPLVLPQRFRENQARKELKSPIRRIQSKSYKLLVRMERTKSLILKTQKKIEAVGSRKKQTQKTKKQLEGLKKVLDKANFDLANKRQRQIEASQEKAERWAARRRRDQIQILHLFSVDKLKKIHAHPIGGIILSQAKIKKRKGLLVGVAGFILPVFKKEKQKSQWGQEKEKKTAEEFFF